RQTWVDSRGAAHDLDLHDSDDWQDLLAFAMTNRPEVLANSFWSGIFTEKNQTYSFLIRSSESGQQSIALSASRSLDIPIPNLPGTWIPSFQNDFAAGIESEIRLAGVTKEGFPDWTMGPAATSTAGQILGNQVSGAPLQTGGIEVNGVPRSGGGQ